LLHAATRGAAQALRLGDVVGTLQPGAMADLCLWDVAVGPVAQRRDALARELHERLFAWVTLGDERNLAETWVAGVRRYSRAPSTGA
jgi:guanine deaminase